MHRRLITSLAVLLGVALAAPVGAAPASAAAPRIVPTHSAYPSGGTNAVGAGIDEANQGAQLAESVPSTVRPSWGNRPPTCPGSGGTSAASISVSGAYTVVDEVGYGCSFVSAYATSTGRLIWRVSSHFAFSATVTDGRVYYEHTASDGEDLVDARRLTDGRHLWSAGITAEGADPRLSVGSGVVSHSEDLLRASSGSTLPSVSDVDVTTQGLSLVAGGAVYYNSDSGVVATSPSGRELWERRTPSGSTVPALHDGLLYLRGPRTLVLDPHSGRVVRYLPASDEPIAFDGDVGFFTTQGYTASTVDQGDAPSTPTSVRAVDLGTGAVLWTHELPMDEVAPYYLDTAPVVENGLVWAVQVADSGSPIELIALDEVSGAVRNDVTDACTAGPGGGNLVFAQHRLFLSTNCGVQTYVGTAAAPRTEREPGELLSDPGFEHGTGGFGPLGDGTVAAVSSPVHGGVRALSVTPTGATSGTVGVTAPDVLAGGKAGVQYHASCWVRPTVAGMSGGIGFQTTQPGVDPPLPTSWDVHHLTAGVWTKIGLWATVEDTGSPVALRVYTTDGMSGGGSLLVDDCSVAPET